MIPLSLTTSSENKNTCEIFYRNGYVNITATKHEKGKRPKCTAYKRIGKSQDNNSANFTTLPKSDYTNN